MLAFYKADDGKSGVFVGKNTRGQMLIEVEGSGEIAAYPKEELTVAAPYTVKIKKLLTPDRIAYASPDCELLHIKARKGALKVGDILVDDGSVTYMVLAVNTKAQSFRLPLADFAG